MTKLWTLCLILALATPAMAQNTIWERNSRTDAAGAKPAWFGTGTERGIAYGVVGGNERVYVASRSNGVNAIRAINPATGTDIDLPTPFTFAGVSGGLFAINDIEITDDGVVVVTNMTTGTTTNPFKAYIWTSEGGDPVHTYSFAPTGGATRRLGDKVAVVGSWSAGTFELWTISPPVTVAPTEPGRVFVHRTTNQGQSWTVQTIELSATLPANATIPANAGIRPIAAGGTSDFFINGNGFNLKRYTSTGAYVDGSAVGATTGFSGVDVHVTAMSATAFNYQYRLTTNADPVIGAISLYDVSVANAPASIGATPFMASATSGTHVTGDVSVKHNPDGTYQVFGLGTDQGLISYGTVYTPPVVSTVLLNETFEYETGSLLTANGWVAHSGAGTNAIAVTAGNLAFPGYAGSAQGKSVALLASGEDVHKALSSSVTSGTVYAAFLVNVTSTSIAGDYFFHLGANPTTTIFYNRLFVKKDANERLAFGLQKTSGTGTASVFTDFVYQLGTTYLIVTGYEFGSEAGDDVSVLSVNPLGSSEPSQWQLVNVAGSDIASIGAVALRQGSAGNAVNATVSGIRVGTDYAAVVGNPTATSISDDREAPVNFALGQNYPNPFNPTTAIQYSLGETANVTLNVYTVTGQLVASLVNEVKPAGVHSVSFDASRLASGVYIYRINAGGYSDTRRMTLIK